MVNVYIVKHNQTGIWQLVTNTSEESARAYTLVTRLSEFQQYVIDTGDISLEDIKQSLEVILIGCETKEGIQFKEITVKI